MSKKAKGFGQSPTPTRKFKDFILAFGDFYRKNSRDKTKLQQFLKANINKLDDLLLDALPLVFTSLITDKSIDEREAIANLFDDSITIDDLEALGFRAFSDILPFLEKLEEADLAQRLNQEDVTAFEPILLPPAD
jgi:hypothetical protein